MANALIPLLTSLLQSDRSSKTALEGVTVLHCPRAVPRSPLIYSPPCLVIIAQGRKIGYLGDREIHYNPGHYLVQTLPLPFECETYASSDAPLLGLSIRIDPVLLAELVHESGPMALADGDPSPMASVPMTGAMAGAAERLLQCLQSPLEARVLGQGRLRELIFEALKGAQGPALRALVQGQGHYARIAQVLAEMCDNLGQEMTVEQLARSASMSLSSFHQHFKDVARCSPLQYLKRLRLLKAQMLLSQDQLNVGQTANAVGYKSVNQFSRDYKRYFGASPNQERRSA
ncbi:AraC family transcriptional regulator [Gallaecimonas xiamenensis]|uniref:AraC family transcriptional regulator n=1 Tax=Gallaecimonas xiamenensis 3-C-1 TaxID=745411 RepID=K2J038_9GAMM|nr:AraC family transcriptional regulator [Gallaecimonas xiamenensis]EKE76201.1 AraC family transcriptional regulator [Gallaecimonas xiamenensis 3-C-1]